jgi:TRAP-type C4-dicarboxylate transport system substrate-binding protein
LKLWRRLKGQEFGQEQTIRYQYGAWAKNHKGKVFTGIDENVLQGFEERLVSSINKKREETMMKHVSKMVVGFLGLMFLWVLVLDTAAFAQDKVIELKYAAQYAPTHPYSVADLKWIAKIEAETKGRVKIKPYWNGTLISGRESMRELAKGVADIAFITPIYEKSGVDLTRAMLDYYRGSDPEANIKIYWEVFEKFPEIRKEYENMKILALDVGAPMHLMTTKKPITTAADLKGIRIRVTGDTVMRTMKELGAEPIGMPVTEMYESLQKGIIQGVIFGHNDYKALKLAEIVKYETENFLSYRGAFPGRAINLDVWNKLPPDVQKIFDANRDWWSVESYKESLKPNDEGKVAAVKAGVQFVQMDQASLQKYATIFDAENVIAAQEVDKKGLPGTKIYNETRRLVKQYNK